MIDIVRRSRIHRVVDRLKNNNLELDNFRAQYDLYSIESGPTRFQIKAPSLDKEGKWHINIGMEHNFDILTVVCICGRFKNIKRAYKIPESELYGEASINIYEDWSKVSRGGSVFKWIEKYKIDEKPYDDAYNDAMIFLGDKKYIGIEDIMKWIELYETKKKDK